MKNNNQQKTETPVLKDLNVQLLLDRVIILPVKVGDEKRASGIEITEEQRKKYANLPRFGHIVAVGPGDPGRGDMTVKKGDLISFLFYSGTPFEFNGQTHLIMREFDIIMIIKNDNEQH